MHRLGWTTIAACTLLLTGCGPNPAEQRAMDQQKCGSYGFNPGTEAFADCMMTVTQQREAEHTADTRAWQDRQAKDAQARRNQDTAGVSGSQPVSTAPPKEAKCTTTTSTVGDTTTTHEECHW
jgi:hypothetical protein